MTAPHEASATILRLGGRVAYATAFIAPIGLAFLVAMYVAFALGAMSQGLVFGWVNDTLAIVTGLLMLPIVVAVHILLRKGAPRASRLALIVGIGANVAIVILQSLLVAGVLTFEQEIGPVLIAFLALVVWFVTTGLMGRSTGVFPHGLRMSVLAATYVGYPFWAVWLGRHLVRGAGESDSARVDKHRAAVARPEPEPSELGATSERLEMPVNEGGR
jgi:hypothetical protein